MSLAFWRNIWECVCMCVCVCVLRTFWRVGGPEKVNSCSSLSQTNTGIHTHMQAPKGSSREAQRCLCARQISHVSLLQHTDRSSQYSLLYEGQVHARRAERKEGGESKSGKEVITPTTSFLSFFTLSSCLPCLSPSLSLSFRTLPLCSPSFSTEESSLSVGIGAL